MRIRAILALSAVGYAASGAVSAHAYLDPGTGSLIIQGVIASIAAASAVLGVYWQNVKSFFKRDRSAPEDSGPEQGTDAES